MEYLLKASAVIVIFYVLYKLFLQRETFFQTNRGYLLIGLLASVLLPLIVIPIYVEYTPTVMDSSILYINSPEVLENPNEMAFDWIGLASIVYTFGAIFFLGKLLIELASLKLLFKKHRFFKNGSYIFIETENDIPPFSFFNWIVYNPKKYTREELQHILNHEKAHARELHSIDIILTQLSCVLLWFNPLIWLYKKEVQQNLEFIADKKAQDFSSCEKSYQLILLKASAPQHKYLTTNNFYNSQIKKRIIMLHKSKSKKANVWKYSLVLPILALFLMSFNTKEIFIEKERPKDSANTAQIEASNQLNDLYENLESKETSTLKTEEEEEATKVENNTKTTGKLTAKATSKSENSTSDVGGISITIIDKNTTDAELDKIKADLKKDGLTLKFKSVKRNRSREITAIKIDAKSKNSNANYNISSDEAISPIKIVYDIENESISIGNGHSKHGKNTFVYETHKDGDYKIHKSGKGNNVYVITEEHDNDVDVVHESRVVVRNNGKKGKVKTVKRLKNVEVISGDDDVIEVIVEDVDNDNIETIVIDSLEDVNVKADIIIEEKGKNVWVSDDDETKSTIIIGDEDGDNNIYISGLNGENPLYIVDGKEVSKEKFTKLNPKKIESVTVLKDESAIKKYGDKGKNGVIIVKTKKN
ncbi:M56 family metallopeptidase [Winogradskyella sp.]|uniref:M56 family metallopeptidase n=1 Tax=Winogradskyella sp. TaxID=1883156 RepID=UPI0026105CA6|nr:M56 family metallopeptidase [Winogradskyella sp.]